MLQILEKLLVALTVVIFTISPSVAQQPKGTTSGQRTPLGANEKGRVSITVTDSQNDVVSFASVFINRVSDSLTVQFSLTDKDGKALLSIKDYGKYYILVESMGYAKHTSESFEISAEHPFYRVPKFQLTTKSQELEGVEIVAKREMLETNLDKKVFNVSSSVIADGATAVEVLQDVPSVDVDIEGNVSLRGSGNVTILVDGRPTNLTLDQIPASMIESIEVITNPSARLEPDGMSGILNVVLKKQKTAGFNGMITVGSGISVFKKKLYYDRGNASVSLNYNYNKINIFLNYDFRYFKGRSAGNMDRKSWFGDDTTHLEQNNSSNRGGPSHNVNTGLDWYINKTNTLSFTFGYNYWGNGDTNILSSNNAHLINNEDVPYLNYQQLGGSNMVSHNFNAGINYKKVFEDVKGRELTADLFFTQRNNNSESRYLQDFSVPISEATFYQKTNTLGLNRNMTAQVDFVTPIGNGGRIETGYKLTYRTIGQDYSLFNGTNRTALTEDLTQSNNFTYNEMINALYFIYSNTFWKKLKFQVGLRAELATTYFNLEAANTVSEKPKTRFMPFPTLHFRYEFNDNHALQLSYSLRVSRPSIWQLNPFRDYSDKQNIRQGNPALTPEYIHSVELGYEMNIKKSSFSLTAFYRYRQDIITRYTEILQDTTDVNTLPYTLTSYQNLTSSQNIGFEMIYSQRLWKFWKLTLSGNFYRVIIDSENLIDENLSRDWSYSFRLNQTFTLPKDWDLQLNFRFRSSSLTTGSMGFGGGGVGQGRQSATYSLGFGIKKAFLKKSLTLSFNIRDLINNTKTTVISYSNKANQSYYSTSERWRSAYQMSVTVSYKINNYKRTQIKQNSGDIDGGSGEMEE